MNKKKLIILSISYWAEDYIKDSIHNLNIGKVDIIIEKKK